MKRMLMLGLCCLPNLYTFGQERFDIVYLADPMVVSDREWLSRMKTDWHASAINLRISWSEVEDARHRLDWRQVDRALEILDSAGLGIYIRVSMNVIQPGWYTDFTKDDFHQRYDGGFYLRPYWDYPERSYRRMLNFRSPVARSKQVSFFRKTVSHLHQSRYAKRIRLIVPAISVDDESEYPTHTMVTVNGKDMDVTMMSGYSAPETKAFVQFLRTKYGALSVLNASWGSQFSSFPEISVQMGTFGWHEQPNDPYHQFQFPNGRKDWLDFRARELKNFLDTLCLVTKSVNKNFRFGLQFGSFYDRLLVFRGFYDPTPLLEKVDFFITDEIIEYRPNFEFASHYSRTLAMYWDWKNRRGAKNKIGFATESNWPGYGFDAQSKGYMPEALCRNWGIQLQTFYQNGASAHFVSLWGTKEAVQYHFVDSIKSGAYMRPDQYLAWSRTLSRYVRPRQQYQRKRAVHLGTAQTFKTSHVDHVHAYSYGEQVGIDTGAVNIDEGYKKLYFYEFPLSRSTRTSIDSTAGLRKVFEYDVVTDYVIEHTPQFLSTHYNELKLTPSSLYMTEKASRALQNSALGNVSIKR